MEIVVLGEEVFIDHVHASLLGRGAFPIAVFNKTTILKLLAILRHNSWIPHSLLSPLSPHAHQGIVVLFNM